MAKGRTSGKKRIHAEISEEAHNMIEPMQIEFKRNGKHGTISNVVEQAIREMHKKLKKNK
jgi:hypothetical protein